MSLVTPKSASRPASRSISKSKALFLDRDGVINVNHGYVYEQTSFEWIEGIFELVQKANEKGYLVFIVTNQSGIGRGYYNEEDFEALSTWMLNEFKKQQLNIAKLYYCPHHPTDAKFQYKQSCSCRKPKPGMAFKAAQEFSVDLSKSVMVGDKITDIEFAENAKIGKAFLYSKSITAEQVLNQKFTIEVNQVSHLLEVHF